ncbi:MAG: MFS transporter [Myxococcales bacterium]|nr:MFS transporter [Myxococcales bacterium]
MNDPGAQRARRSAIGFAVSARFVDGLGHGALIPIAPFELEAAGASPAVITLWVALYPAIYVLLAPYAGRLSDRYGRRGVIVGGAALAALGYGLFAISDALVALFCARLLMSVGGTNATAAGGALLDVSQPAETGRMMGLRSGSFGLGILLGPAIGGYLAGVSVEAPAAALAGILVLYTVAAAWLLPETLRRVGGESAHAFNPWTRSFTTLLATYAIASIAVGLVYPVLPLLVDLHLVIGPESDVVEAARLTAYVVSAWGLAAAVSQIALAGRAIARLGAVKLVRASALFWALAFALMPPAFDAGFREVLLVIVAAAVPYGLVLPALNTLVSQSAPGAEARALGLGDAADALGFVLGAAVAGLMFAWSPALPFYAAMAVLVSTAAMTLVLARPAPPLAQPVGVRT